MVTIFEQSYKRTDKSESDWIILIKKTFLRIFIYILNKTQTACSQKWFSHKTIL